VRGCFDECKTLLNKSNLIRRLFKRHPLLLTKEKAFAGYYPYKNNDITIQAFVKKV